MKYPVPNDPLETLLSEQQALLSVLDEFELPRVSLDFNRRLWQRIEATPEPSFLETVRSWLRPAIPLAAAAALIVIGFVYDHRAISPLQPGVSITDAEKVERALDDIQLLGQFEKAQEGDPKV